MTMSAACEVMNQMMGASATALSQVLGCSVNISTPEAELTDTTADLLSHCTDFHQGDSVVVISFKLHIKDLVDTTFNCILSTVMTKEIVNKLNGEEEEAEVEAAVPASAPTPAPAPVPAPPPRRTGPPSARPPPLQNRPV